MVRSISPWGLVWCADGGRPSRYVYLREKRLIENRVVLNFEIKMSVVLRFFIFIRYSTLETRKSVNSWMFFISSRSRWSVYREPWGWEVIL